jgi:hypothetical protein
MADMILAPKNLCLSNLSNLENISLVQNLGKNLNWSLNLSGLQNTYSIVKIDNDWVISIGYSNFPNMPSMTDSLRQLLFSFNENEIKNIKIKLVGQYILIIKKDNFLYIFSDFIGGRNIFYNSQKNILSSSFSFVESIIGIRSEDLDPFKLAEFLAAREILYPCWLGSKTANKRINWLLPYEYIKVNLDKPEFEIRAISFYLNNKKESDIIKLSEQLIDILDSVIYKQEYENDIVAASITGGRDTRLIASVVQKKYHKVHYRIAVSSFNKNSIKDLKIAKKISKIDKVPLEIYELNIEEHENIFRKLTEGFAPAFNITIAPLIINANKYKIGFGGVYGTEIFTPIYAKTISDYIHNINIRLRRRFEVNNDFYDYINSSLSDQFKSIKTYYKLQHDNDKDYIRLFQLLLTARYSSFILSAYNQFSYDFEPFGSFGPIELALKIDESLWGNKKSLKGDALIEKYALFKISPEKAKVIAFSSYRPVMPLSLKSCPRFLLGFSLQLLEWLTKKIYKRDKINYFQISKSISYASNDWQKYYIERFNKYLTTDSK